jgi:Gram-negative bacterial TonB protein C-terminal
VESYTRYLSLLGLIALVVASIPSFAQDAAAAVQKLPSDPRELMLLAAKSNNLTEDGLQPWHLKATFKVFDENGNTIDQGTYEEFWVGITKHKMTVAGVDYKQTYYATDKGFVRTGPQYLPSFQLDALGAQFADPLPRLKAIPKIKFALKVADADGFRFACLGPPTYQIFEDRTYCLESDSPVLRAVYSATFRTQYVHSGIIRFQDRYVAGDLRFLQAGKLVLSAHLDKIEPLVQTKDEDFTPPPDAVQDPPNVRVEEGTLDAMLVKKVTPVYPKAAKLAHVDGPVVLAVQFSLNGQVAAAYVIDGPQLLREAALDAVHQWVSKPFAVRGEPVEATSIIHLFRR